MNTSKQLLLLSSYAALTGLATVFRQYQYQLIQVKTLREALSTIKKIKPDVIVAEFVYAPTYGSQLSNFESLFAAVQNFTPEASFIALAHKEDLKHLEKISMNLNNYWVLTLPLDKSVLEDRLNSISETG